MNNEVDRIWKKTAVVLATVWKDWGKPQIVQLVSRPRLEPNTYRMQIWTPTAWAYFLGGVGLLLLLLYMTLKSNFIQFLHDTPCYERVQHEVQFHLRETTLFHIKSN
jgi:hypothetical protein